MTLAELEARRERYVEQRRERERLERLRLGIATAVLARGPLKKRDGQPLTALDVFPDLGGPEPEASRGLTDEQNADQVLAMFRGLAARQRAQQAR